MRIRNKTNKPFKITLEAGGDNPVELDQIVKPNSESDDIIGLEDGDNNCNGADVLIIRDSGGD